VIPDFINVPKPMPTWQKVVLGAGVVSCAVILGTVLAPAVPVTAAVAGKVLAARRWGRL
jgi:K+ transporter